MSLNLKKTMKTTLNTTHSNLNFMCFHPSDENNLNVDDKIINHHFSSNAM